MPTPSENHGFDLYDQGETPWTHRDDFEDLDKRLELRGGLSERPADAPDGTLFIETDESDGTPGARWRYDADAGQWVQQPLAAPAVQTEEGSTSKLEINDPDGEKQAEIVGLGPSNELQDEDGAGDPDQASGFALDNGILLRGFTTNYTRWVIGRDSSLGVRKDNDIGGAGEVLKNPAATGYVALENDFDDGIFAVESKEGGGFEVKTSDPSTSDTNDEVPRFKVTDPEDSSNPGKEVRILNTEFLRTGVKQRFFDPLAPSVVGSGWTMTIVPDSGNSQTKFTAPSGHKFSFQPNFSEKLGISENRVSLGNASDNVPAHMEPQDVRNISSPQQGDISYHGGAGSNTVGPAHYDGSNWVSLVDGSTIS
jgi:hypothetical protein